MKKITILFLLLPFITFGQVADDRRAIDNRLYPAGDVEVYDLRKRTKIKRFFLENNWLECQFLFLDTSKTQRTFPLKLDILNQELVVDLYGSEYIVPMDSIHGFVLEDYYSQVSGNAKREFTIRRNNSKSGKRRSVFEIIVKGEYQLLVGYYAEMLKANYNAAIDVGSLDEKIVKKDKFYLIDDDGRLFEIPKKKKAAIAIFNKYPAANKFLAKNKVNFKSKESLNRLVLFMNQN
ncbi:MAG: hypothetical protein ACI9XO_000566 [Paraglaciecola sp.]